MAELLGHARPISDGTVYPAIARLIASGAITATKEPGTRAAMRRSLTLNAEGRTPLTADDLTTRTATAS
jgi:DNA-binding PadR family transcriptional regulator